ncbi:MAG: helix-turn-helix domain-containing protein [bacterium]
MKKSVRSLVFRPHAAPSPNIPLGARSVGHYRVGPADAEKPQVKHFVQIFWGIEGRGAFGFDAETRTLHPGEIAVYLPGMEHRLRPLDDTWEYRWWTLDGPLAPVIVAGFGLAADIYRVGPAPVELFEKLARLLLDLSPHGERNASAVAYQLLARAAVSGRAGGDPPVIAEALRIIHRHAADPLFGVARLAQMLRTHRSTLSRGFMCAVGVSPLEYLTRLRVQNALALLKQSTRSIAEIARQCGYSDPNYFSRLIRRHTGHPPQQFRQGRG